MFIIIKVVLDSSAVEHSAVNRRVVGSNPTRGVLKSVSQLLADFNFEKINIRLRGQAVKTSPFHGGNTGSIPVGVTEYKIFVMYADVAQLAEQLICNQQVIGSSPIIGSLDL